MGAKRTDNTKPAGLKLNKRYYNHEIDDDLPWKGIIRHDSRTGLLYDEDGDVLDEESLAEFCAGDGRGKDE